jgi:triosephosphate isomerase
MRKKIVAGNWKMNLTKSEALNLYQSLANYSKKENLEVSVFSSFLFLDALKSIENEVGIGAQNFYHEEKGAFTGEVSFSQLKDLGIQKVLIGHSERRMLFNEGNDLIKLKVNQALNNKFDIIYCCGEPIEIREEKRELHYVYKQLELNLFHLSKDQIKNIVIAYEPIWAIGTGKTATIEQAEDMHRNIRIALKDKYDKETADSISIIYGGSCNAKNAKDLFECKNIDGGLIGGASLITADFLKIIDSMN